MQNAKLRSRPICWLLATVMVYLVLAAPAAVSKDMEYDEHRRHYRISNVDPEAEADSGRRLFRATEYSIQAHKDTLDGRSVFVIDRQEKSPEGHRSEYKFYVESGNQKMLRIERKLISNQGKVVETRNQNYEDHLFKYEPNTFHMNMFPFVAQKMNLTPGKETEFFVIMSPEFTPWGVYLAVDGEEQVTVPAGTFDCVRVKVRYQTDNLPSFFKKLPSFITDNMLPDVFLWVDKAAPHAMVKLQGKLEGFAAPEKVHELVKVE